MPASRSRSRSNSPQPSADTKRSYWGLVAIGVLAGLGVLISALPASMVSRLLPPAVQADDFSGSVWHGTAGKIRLYGLDAGALEWRLHPASLLHRSIHADLHWLLGAFALDADALIDGQGLTASALRGGGPIEDLRDFSRAADWRGNAEIAIDKMTLDAHQSLSLAGDLRVSDLSSARFSGGASLGGYVLHFADGPPAADGMMTGLLSDMGGPLQVQGSLKFSLKEHRGLLSGTLQARATAPAELRKNLDDLAQMRGRDPQGRIPIELEFTY